MKKPRRINFSVVVEQRGSDGKFTAMVADHGGNLPGSETGHVKVAKFKEDEATTLATMISVALYKGMRDHGILRSPQQEGPPVMGDE